LGSTASRPTGSDERESIGSVGNQNPSPFQITKDNTPLSIGRNMCFLFFGPGIKTVQPIENERKGNQPMND
jgi:hypothetical protein